MSSYDVDRLAARILKSEARVDGLVRAQQAARTVIAGVTIADHLDAASATGEMVDSMAVDVEGLNASDALYLDSELTPVVPVEDLIVVDAVLMADDIRAITEAANARIADAEGELETRTLELDEALRAARDEREDAQAEIDRERDRIDAAFGTAGEAFTMAGTKSRITYSAEDPEGEGSENEVWRTIDEDGNVLREWRYMGDSVWQESLITTEAITNLDVGKLTVGTAIMSDVVAQEIAARSGKFVELDVDQLTVTGSSVMDDLVLEKIFAEAVVAKTITSTEKFITKDVLATGSVTSEKVEAGISITAPTISGGILEGAEVYGGKFYGNEFEGGLFTLPSIASETIIATDTFESSVSPWERADPGYTVPTRSTAQAQSGSASMLLGRNGAEFGAFRAIPATSFPNGGYISMWVRRSAAGTVALGADNSFVQTPLVVEANTWTELRRTLPPGSTASIMWILGTLPDSGGTAYADSVRVVRYNSAAGLAAVDRDDAGRARVYSVDAAGDVSGLRDGRAYSLFKNGAIEYSSETGPIPGGGLGTQGVQQILKQVSAARTAELKVQMWSTGAASLVSSATDRAQSQVSLTEDILLRGDRIYIDGIPVFVGDMDWTDIPYNADHESATAHGPLQMCKIAGIVYYRGGASKKTGTFATNAETTVTSSVPAIFRPSQPIRSATTGAVGRVGSGLIHPDGRIIFTSRSELGVSAWWAMSGSYPAN